MNNPAHHTIADIHLVAAGLMRITDLTNAGEQLERIYGRERTESALLLLARSRGVSPADHAFGALPEMELHAEIDLTLAVPVARFSQVAGGAGRRGTRPTDWL